MNRTVNIELDGPLSTWPLTIGPARLTKVPPPAQSAQPAYQTRQASEDGADHRQHHQNHQVRRRDYRVPGRGELAMDQERMAEGAPPGVV